MNKDKKWLKEALLELKNKGNPENNQTEKERELGRAQHWAWNNCVDRAYELAHQLDEPEVNSQIDKLANFIMSEVEGEPSRSQGAVDTAIRIIKSYQNQALDRLKQPLTLAEFIGWEVGAEYEDDEGHTFRVTEHNDLQTYYINDKQWGYFLFEWRRQTWDRLRSAKKVEQKNKYRIPLPNLITTDGKQQYLTEKEGHWFASRLTEDLKQEWTVDEFKNIPEYYRHYAREMVR